MAVPEELRPLTQELNSRLRESPSIYALTTAGRSPYWFGSVLSSVILLAEGDDLVYVSGRFDREAATAAIVVVTSRLVISVRVGSIEGEMGTITVQGVPRDALIALGVQAGETPFSSEAFSGWPGELTITAEYAGLDDILELPLERVYDGNDQVRALFEALKKDLLHD